MLQTQEFVTVLGTYRIKRLLGKGKSGYSYLADLNGEPRVIKMMHDEPVHYYTFEENKVKLEVEDYALLHKLEVVVPILYEYSVEHNYVVKEYVAGKLAAELIAANAMTPALWRQIFDIAHMLKRSNLNIDYFPTNFVVNKDEQLVYVDYETNLYMPQWDFEHWGIYYWANPKEMAGFLRHWDGDALNIPPQERTGLEATIQELLQTYR